VATIAQIREGIATNLRTIAGLRTTDTVPDNPQPPVAIVSPSSIQYDLSFQRGLDLHNFVVMIVVGRASERNAQRTLDLFCAGTGASSVKAAIESNRTLTGLVQDLRVTSMRNYGSTLIGETTYLAVEFDLVVYTQ
jgi:hypothetical protein